MNGINARAIYVLWLREIRKFIRAPSRLIGTLITPLFFLVFLGLGFSNMAIPGMNSDVSYIAFLVPGIIGMNMLFSSTFTGVSVLWDREFGFLKEIMVAPVSRINIVLGRIAGGLITSVIPAVIILFVSLLLGFRIPSIFSFFAALVFMLLIAMSFIGIGLIIASNMRDMQGFQLIVNFVIFPLMFLSGAIFPTANLPNWIKIIAYADPLTYGVDGMRGVLIGSSALSPLINFIVLAAFSIVIVITAAYAFEKSQSI